MIDSSDTPGFDPAEILACLGHAVITTDLAGTVVYWNSAAEALYGWTADEAIGHNVASLTVPAVAQSVAADIMAALRIGVPWSGGFPVSRKDGGVFPALVTNSGIYWGGEMIGIIGVSTNLGTALRPLLERSTDAALVLRLDAVITYASPAAHQLFGWDVEGLIGSSIVPLLHADDRAALARLLDDVAVRPGAHPPVEIRVRTHGSWAWAEAALTNLLDDPGVRGVVCNLRFSAARSAREAAEARAAQLEKALRSRLVIELAKGFLIGRDGISEEEAFQQLRRQARNQQMKVHDVCRGLLEENRVVDS